MYFEAGQCVDATGFLVKPVLRSGVQTAIAWRWNQVDMGCGQGGSLVQEPSHRSQAGVAVREGLRSERAALLPLDVQCPVIGDQDGYAVGARRSIPGDSLVVACDITVPMRHAASLARRRGRAGLKWVSTKSEAICCFTLSNAWWQAAVHLQAVPFCRSALRGWRVVERLGKKRA